MNTIKKLLEGRYESPEMTVVELELEGAVLSGSEGSGSWGRNEEGGEI